MMHDTLCISRVNTPCIATARIAVDMSGSPKADRLRQARIAAGFTSASEAAQRFGWGEASYRHHENATRNYGPDAAKRYGRAFKVKPAWLLGLDPSSELAAVDHGGERLEVNGSVAAGVWRESEHWNDERQFVIDLPSPVPGARRFGLEVEGLSMDLFYAPGAVLDCISIYSAEVRPADGDHVIVERVRPDGLRELTVKEYRERDGERLLVPRSSDARFKPIVYPGPDDPARPTTEERVEIIAFVVTSYPRQSLDLMRRMGLLVRAGEKGAKR